MSWVAFFSLVMVFRLLPLTALLLPMSHAVVVMVSDTETTSEVNDFLNANFINITEIRNSDYSDITSTAAQDALNGTGSFASSGAADLLIIGRTLSSGDYQNTATDFNDLDIPVVAWTSFVTRKDGNRLG